VSLRRIVSRVEDHAAVVAIVASAPVPYTASQPDPTTFIIELRDVTTSGVDNAFTSDPRHPVSAVALERAESPDGAALTRIRMTLDRAIRPRVRSARHVIYVEADRADSGTDLPSVPVSPTGPSAAIHNVRVERRGSATAVTLVGTSRLVATSIEQPEGEPARVVMRLPNVTSAVPLTTTIGHGPVQQVRVGIDPAAPLLTQVAFELSRPVPYRVESSAEGRDLTLVFDERAADPLSALEQESSASLASDATVLPAAVPATDQRLGSRARTGPARLMQAQTPPAQAPPAQALAAQGPAPQAPPAQAPAPQLPAAQAPAPQGPVPQAPTPQTPAGQPRFTGDPVSLDFQGADLRAVLRTFSEISGLNMVIDPSIQGTVEVVLTDVPWDQALDIILRSNRLGYVIDGTIVRIVPLTVLAEEEAQRRRLAEEQALAGELQVLTRTLSYARAENLRDLLTQTALSQRGSVQFDQRTNTLIITDLADRLQRANELIDTLDRPEPQVEIEARIVQTSRDFARQIGVQWGVAARATGSLGNTLPFAFPNQGSISGRTGVEQGAWARDAADLTNTAVNLGVNSASSAIGLALGSINGAVNLDVALSALEESGQGRILSTPRVSTQNNIEAEITQGVQIPIQTVANNTVTVQFRDAALSLRVTPQITATNTVIMRISVENASPDFSRAVNGIPPIDTQRALTQVLVGDGDTTVIGGIYVSREQAAQDRTPGLHRIPLLGWLFQRSEFADESRELLIFITPRITRL
jgi:type IV pilus assembly protein PilQ